MPLFVSQVPGSRCFPTFVPYDLCQAVRYRDRRTHCVSSPLDDPATTPGGDWVSRVSRMAVLGMRGVLDSLGLRVSRDFVTAQSCLPSGLTHSASLKP